MIENADSWLQTLAARGVTVTLRNNRIDIHPYIAFSQLSDEELLFLRHNREAIKAAVRAGFTPSAVSESNENRRSASNAAAPDPKPAPQTARSEALPNSPASSPTVDTKCPYCDRSPCIGVDHPAFYTLHPEAAQARENARLNEEFWLAMGMAQRR